MNQREVRAVIFDCDGTLVDSEPISLRVFVNLIIEQGFQIDHKVAVRKWAGCDLHEVMSEVESRLERKLPVDFLDIFRAQQMEQLAEDVTAIAGAHDLLTSVNIPRAVASNAPQQKVRLCLEKTGLLDFFDTDRIFSAYDIQIWKPRPDLFLSVADSLGVAPEHCAVVEDSKFGVQAGLDAGMQVFCFDPHEELDGFANVPRVKRLHELMDRFAAW
jgi:HAD superfamily hydrolase (TIGR01509 family)